MYTDPTVSQFQAWFNRDFPYGGSPNQVMDSDISKALTMQQNWINQCIWPNQNVYTQAALLLSAYFLVQNLRVSSQGIASKFDWTTVSKSVGQVSSSFQIPDRILENPELAIYAANGYGVQYLQMLIPYLTGVAFSVAGGTIGPVEGIFSGPYGAVGPWNGPFEN